jgi:hypothetical protein
MKNFLKGVGLGLVLLFLAAATIDTVTQGSVPSAAGDVLCYASSTPTATFQQPSACFGASLLLDPAPSTAVSPGLLGWTGSSSGDAFQMCLGDTANTLQGGFGDKLQLVSYHGIHIVGARGTTTPQAFASGGGTADVALTVVGNGSSNALEVQGATKLGSSGTAISGSFRGTVTNPALTGAQACLDTTVTVTGAATGAECLVGLPSGIAANIGVSITCYVSATNTAKLHVCNVTAAGITPTPGTYSVRVFNP